MQQTIKRTEDQYDHGQQHFYGGPLQTQSSNGFSPVALQEEQSKIPEVCVNE